MEMNAAINKLDHDLKVMDSLGFNVVRLRSAMYWKNDTLHIPSGSYAEYFKQMDTLMAKCARHNLRVIMVVSDNPNTYNQFDQYCVFLDSLTRHYGTNKTVMAYVVFMEPSYKWGGNTTNDKLMISNWSRKWYYLIKKNAPNQLVTYGLDGVNNVICWDPAALTYDFLTWHQYYPSSYASVSSQGVGAYFKWMNDNINDVWVLGETGFSGTDDTCSSDPLVGTEYEQYRYADLSMQRSLECGCKGFAWWQYQEVKWISCLEDHFGILTYYPKDSLKAVASVFPTYSSRTVQNGCRRPANYYDIPGYSHPTLRGVVKDIYSNPVKDAFVQAWTPSYKTHFSTFTNSQGEYTLCSPQDSVIRLVWISQTGYDGYKEDYYSTPTDSINVLLTRINYNHWKKNWTNVNYPVAGDIPMITNSDAVVVGNFCGDEAEELLVIKHSSNTAILYRYNVHHWEQIWTGVIGNWQISSTDKFYSGDYNGDGYDELFCVQDILKSWAKIYRYNPQNTNNPWQNTWANTGNGQIGNWNYQPGDVILPGRFNDSTYCSLMCIRKSGKQKNALCQQLSAGSWVSLWSASTVLNDVYIGSWVIGSSDKYYVGDFSGDGIDELFCVQATTGITDKMTLLQYNTSWGTLWTNNGSSAGVSIYPYRANLHVGNFDKDRADEVLGVETWATKFNFDTSNQWSWSWSTYDSAMLSDWMVNPNHRIFFMKVMTDVPDYLFVSRIMDNHYRFDAYSYDP